MCEYFMNSTLDIELIFDISCTSVGMGAESGRPPGDFRSAAPVLLSLYFPKNGARSILNVEESGTGYTS